MYLLYLSLLCGGIIYSLYLRGEMFLFDPFLHKGSSNSNFSCVSTKILFQWFHFNVGIDGASILQLTTQIIPAN